MTENCRACGKPLPDDPEWTHRICPVCQDAGRTPMIPVGSRPLTARAPGTCAKCGVPLLSDERERGICGACVKRSKFTLMQPKGHAADDVLPPVVVGRVGHYMDIFDNERDLAPATPVEDWVLGRATFTKDIQGTSFLVVLQFHMNGGKPVVMWRQGGEVSCLRFEGDVTEGFKPFSPADAREIRVMSNGLVVSGQVQHADAVTGQEMVNLLDRSHDVLSNPDSWGPGKFRKSPVIVVSLPLSGKVTDERPVRPAITGPRTFLLGSDGEPSGEES